MANLFQNIGFQNALELIRPHILEETVQIAWQLILTEFFPGRVGFKYGFKSPILANNNMPDAMVTEVRLLPVFPGGPLGWYEQQILLVECKRPSLDTPDGLEDTLTGQFEDDLSQSLNHTGRLFGAIAIGTPKVRPLHPFPYDMQNAIGIADVENELRRIRATGWQWAA
ncbi:hypothetical protein BJX99DRAFT_251965 [Aspergillus californicus]